MRVKQQKRPLLVGCGAAAFVLDLQRPFGGWSGPQFPSSFEE
jgi:hypothetical protein